MGNSKREHSQCPTRVSFFGPPSDNGLRVTQRSPRRERRFRFNISFCAPMRSYSMDMDRAHFQIPALILRFLMLRSVQHLGCPSVLPQLVEGGF